MLRVNDVSIRCGSRMILDRLSFAVGACETIALVGANGAGKTTAAHAVAGLRRINSGSITLKVAGKRDERLDRMQPWTIARLGVQYVPAERPIFETLTVREHLLFHATVTKHERAAVRRALDCALEVFPLVRAKLNQVAGTLSGGEKRVLALATAYVGSVLRANAGVDESILILDEPTHGLAPIAIQGVAAAMTSLQESGVTLIVVEQNIDFARRTASRGYLMAAGRIIWSGLMKELPHDRDMLMEKELACRRC